MKYLKIAIVILTVLAVGLFIDQQAAAQSGRQTFAQIITKTLTVTSTASFQDAVTFDSTVAINDNYPLVYASSGEQIVCGSQTITGTAAIDLSGSLSDIEYANATLSTDPGADAGDAFMVSIDTPVSTTTLTINVWQDDATAATAGAAVQYCAIGTD